MGDNRTDSEDSRYLRADPEVADRRAGGRRRLAAEPHQGPLGRRSGGARGVASRPGAIRPLASNPAARPLGGHGTAGPDPRAQSGCGRPRGRRGPSSRPGRGGGGSNGWWSSPWRCCWPWGSAPSWSRPSSSRRGRWSRPCRSATGSWSTSSATTSTAWAGATSWSSPPAAGAGRLLRPRQAGHRAARRHHLVGPRPGLHQRQAAGRTLAAPTAPDHVAQPRSLCLQSRPSLHGPAGSTS